METGGALREEEREARGSVFGEYRHSFFFFFWACVLGVVGWGLVWFGLVFSHGGKRERN